MQVIPDTIVLKRHRDLAGRKNEIWVRRGLFGLVCLVPLLALLNVFGQRPGHTVSAGGSADVEVYAPARVRGGLLWEARFRITAHEEIRKATLVLAPGWLEGMTLNTIEPAPEKETSSDGKLSLDLGSLAAGEEHVLFLQFQTNPTNVGRRSQAVQLYDGDRKLVELHRQVTVFP